MNALIYYRVLDKEGNSVQISRSGGRPGYRWNCAFWTHCVLYMWLLTERGRFETFRFYIEADLRLICLTSRPLQDPRRKRCDGASGNWMQKFKNTIGERVETVTGDMCTVSLGRQRIMALFLTGGEVHSTQSTRWPDDASDWKILEFMMM